MGIASGVKIFDQNRPRKGKDVLSEADAFRKMWDGKSPIDLYLWFHQRLKQLEERAGIQVKLE
jgi:hypothetical protein